MVDQNYSQNLPFFLSNVNPPCKDENVSTGDLVDQFKNAKRALLDNALMSVC